MAALVDLKRAYYIDQLGLTDSQGAMMSLHDLEYAFFLDPPAPGGGGGGDPAMGGDLTGVASNAQLGAGVVGETEINVAIKDPVAGTPGLRTLGTGAQQAAAGNDTRITGAEQVANKGAASGYASLDGTTKIPIAQVPTGTSGTTVALGNDSRITGAEQTTNKGATNGYASLAGGTVPIAQLPTGTSGSTVAIGNDSRITGAQQTSAKDAANGYPGLDSSGLLSIARLPAGSTVVVRKTGGIWPGGDADTGVRPTSRSDITVIWQGADPSPDIVASGTGGMLDNVDVRWITT